MTFLKVASQNVMDFMTGTMQPFEEIQIKEDYWFDQLIKPSTYDDDCNALLSIMLPTSIMYIDTAMVQGSLSGSM